MKIEVWGNAIWYLFHTLAYKLKDEYKTEVPVLYNFILQICHNLPCPDCKTHAVAYFKRVNKGYVTSSKENLINFLWKFHNDVNIRLKKSTFSKEKLNELYSKASLYRIVMNFLNVMNGESHNIKMMVQNISRKKCINNFKNYISKNNYKYNQNGN